VSVLEWISDLRIRSVLRDAHACALGEIPEGRLVRVTGKIVPHRARVLEAPLSGRLCAYYSLEVDGWPYRLIGRSRRTSIVGEQEAVSFVLSANGASVVIDPTDAWISSGFDHVVDRRDGRLDERVRALYRRLARPRISRWERLVFREAILAIDERVTVFGAAMDEPDRDAGSAGGYRDGAPTHFVFRGSARFPLVIRDDIDGL
jgi:hypothetical protein